MTEVLLHVEKMTQEEYKNLSINYSYASTAFGDIIIASTSKGICCIEFADDHSSALDSLKNRFPHATFIYACDSFQQQAVQVFTNGYCESEKITLHLKGTDFQLKVWNALMEIPMGELTTYNEIAKMIDKPKACRAVGTAIGKNPIALLIPCHRVINASGEYGNYRWGKARKKNLIEWEISQKV